MMMCDDVCGCGCVDGDLCLWMIKLGNYIISLLYYIDIETQKIFNQPNRKHHDETLTNTGNTVRISQLGRRHMGTTLAQHQI